MYTPSLFITTCNLTGTRAQRLAWRLTRKQDNTIVTGYVNMGLIRNFLVFAKCTLDTHLYT